MLVLSLIVGDFGVSTIPGLQLYPDHPNSVIADLSWA